MAKISANSIATKAYVTISATCAATSLINYFLPIPILIRLTLTALTFTSTLILSRQWTKTGEE